MLVPKLKQWLQYNGESVHPAGLTTSQHSQHEPFPSTAKHLPGMHPHCTVCPYLVQHIRQLTLSHKPTHFSVSSSFPLPLAMGEALGHRSRSLPRQAQRHDVQVVWGRWGVQSSLTIRASVATSFHC